MSTPKTITHKELDDAIVEALSELKSFEAHTDEYAAIVKNLDQLYAIRSRDVSDNETDTPKVDKLSKDSILAVAGNLAGIVLILGYERVHVVASKALGFVIKSRV